MDLKRAVIEVTLKTGEDTASLVKSIGEINVTGVNLLHTIPVSKTDIFVICAYETPDDLRAFSLNHLRGLEGVAKAYSYLEISI